MVPFNSRWGGGGASVVTHTAGSVTTQSIAFKYKYSI